MFTEGDFISYGINGVCKVEGITLMEAPGSGKQQRYYMLKPVYSQRGIIYCPIDDKKGATRRKILTKRESYELLDHMNGLGRIESNGRKDFDEKCKQAMLSGDCEEWMKVFKTLWQERTTRLEAGKKMTTTHERLLKAAEDNLCGELAVSLETEKSQIACMLKERLTAN